MKQPKHQKENNNAQYPKKSKTQGIVNVFRMALMLALLTSGVQGYTQNQKKDTSGTQTSVSIKKNTLPKVDHESIITTFPLYIFKEYGQEVGMELFREHMRIEINKIRKSYGKGEVVFDEYLNQKAQEYAEYMAKNKHFAHEDMEGNSFVSWVNVDGNFYYPLQENLGKGLMDITTFLNNQMASKEHKKTIIEANFLNAGSIFKHFGVGYKGGYWVIVFGGEK